MDFRQGIDLCGKERIRLSGLRLGMPSAVVSDKSRKQEYQDNTGRIEGERTFRNGMERCHQTLFGAVGGFFCLIGKHCLEITIKYY